MTATRTPPLIGEREIVERLTVLDQRADQHDSDIAEACEEREQDKRVLLDAFKSHAKSVRSELSAQTHSINSLLERFAVVEVRLRSQDDKLAAQDTRIDAGNVVVQRAERGKDRGAQFWATVIVSIVSLIVAIIGFLK